MEWFYSIATQYWTSLVEILAFDVNVLKEPEMILRITLQMVLLFGSAFFSGSETALFSLSRMDLQQLRRERNPYSEKLHSLLDQPRRLIISILCGNELINIAAAANMTGILIILYGEGNAGWINIFVMVPLILLFGEVTPKTIAVSNPVRFSTKLVARPMVIWVQLITPLRRAIRLIADRVTTWIVGEETDKDNILQMDEFRSLVDEVANKGQLTDTESALIYNLLEAGDTEIVEIMTPRTKIFYINYKWPIELMIERFKMYKHPRIPVFKGQHDRIVGFMHAEDVLNTVLTSDDLSQVKRKDIIRPPVVVPLTKKVDEMFDFFQENNTRAAIVLNEFGGVEGLITVRDVLNFIFGQVTDDISHNELYQMEDENYYDVPGDMKLTDFENLSNFGIEDPRMTTIGGYAFRYLDHLPRLGDKVKIDDITIVILSMDTLRIETVRVIKGPPEAYLENLPIKTKIKKTKEKDKHSAINGFHDDEYEIDELMQQEVETDTEEQDTETDGFTDLYEESNERHHFDDEHMFSEESEIEDDLLNPPEAEANDNQQIQIVEEPPLQSTELEDGEIDSQEKEFEANQNIAGEASDEPTENIIIEETGENEMDPEQNNSTDLKKPEKQ